VEALERYIAAANIDLAEDTFTPSSRVSTLERKGPDAKGLAMQEPEILQTFLTLVLIVSEPEEQRLLLMLVFRTDFLSVTAVG